MGKNFLAVVRRGIEVVLVTECLTIHSRRLDCGVEKILDL
jgi:hypothetical protein